MRSAEQTVVVRLDAPDDFAGFRQAARALLALGVEPDAIHWRYHDALTTHHAVDDLFANPEASSAGMELTPDALDRVPLAPTTATRIKKAQLDTLRNACCHRNAGRLALCYRWLWRVQQQPSLAGDVLDADWCDINRLAHAVGREIHKMHAFVRFRPVEQPGGECLHMAWFEPDHHIVRAGSDFFVRRFANMHWAILTPDACALWDKQGLHMLPGATADQAPAPDAGEALWLTYYQSTFNPARLKEQAMLKEMPRRYWKNLPEAQLISGLVANARGRTASMLASLESLDAPNDS